MKLKEHAKKNKNYLIAAAVICAVAILVALFAMGGQQAANSAATNLTIGAGALAANNTNGDTTMANKTVAKKGDTVAVDYEGRLEDGTLFDTSVESVAKEGGIAMRPSYEPLEFTVGAGQMIAGFDKAVVGMAVGDEKTVKLAPKDAYGEWDPMRVVLLPTNQLEAQLGANVTAGLELHFASGATGKILSFDANNTKVDVNHALAGKTLVFKITMRKIN